MKLLKSRESGQTVVMALILLAVGSLLVVPMLNQSFTNLGYHQSIECRTLTSYSADAGVEYVLCKLYNTPGAYTDNSLQESLTLNDRTVNVTAEYMGGGIYEVTSVASGGGCGSTTIEAYVNLSAGSFTYCVAAKNYLIIKNAQVDSLPDLGEGNIHSNGNIDIEASVVDGDASAVGTISGQEMVTGIVTEGSSEVTFPGDYSGLYKTMAQEGGTYTGDLEFADGTYYLGPLYIDGDLTIWPNTILILEGTIYVTGQIKVMNGRFQGEENICCEGDIDISGGGYGSEIIPIFTSVSGNIRLVGPVIDAVVYAPNGSVSLVNLQLYGAVGGVDVEVKNATVTYAAELHGRQDLPGGELSTISYIYK